MKYHLPNIATYSANKKLLLYLAVLASTVFLIFMGVWIEGKVTNGAEEEARLYQTALQVTSDKELNYAIDTKQGRVLAPIVLKPVDLVKFPEMNKEYPWVQKTEETYTKHTREVCTYDEDGNVEECHDEDYYTWDTTDSWTLSASEIDMAGRKYPFKTFSIRSKSIDAKHIIDGQDGRYVTIENKSVWNWPHWGDNEGDKRYSYDIVELPQSGTVFLNVSERLQPAFGSKVGLYNQSPQDLVKSAQNRVKTESTIFTVLWTLFVLIVLVGGGFAVWNYEGY